MKNFDDVKKMTLEDLTHLEYDELDRAIGYLTNIQYQKHKWFSDAFKNKDIHTLNKLSDVYCQTLQSFPQDFNMQKVSFSSQDIDFIEAVMNKFKSNTLLYQYLHTHLTTSEHGIFKYYLEQESIFNKINRLFPEEIKQYCSNESSKFIFERADPVLLEKINHFEIKDIHITYSVSYGNTKMFEYFYNHHFDLFNDTTISNCLNVALKNESIDILRMGLKKKIWVMEGALAGGQDTITSFIKNKSIEFNHFIVSQINLTPNQVAMFVKPLLKLFIDKPKEAQEKFYIIAHTIIKNEELLKTLNHKLYQYKNNNVDFFEFCQKYIKVLVLSNTLKSDLPSHETKKILKI